MSRVHHLSAPASSANLGSGFDAVALALDLRMRAEIVVRDAGPSTFRGRGVHAPTHDGLRAAFDDALAHASHGRPLPPLDVTLENAIPLGAGLGSSAAARALGAATATLLLDGSIDRAHVARTACALEGHPDNALAATYGGLVVGIGHGAGEFVRHDAPGLAAAVLVVDAALSTSDARGLLPASYSRPDAALAVARAALLGAAIGSGRWDVLRAATRDVLHEPYRGRAYPWLAPAVAAALAEPAVIAATLSGAGPSVIALAPSAAVLPVAAMRQAAEATGVSVRDVLTLVPSANGVRQDSV